MQRPIAWLERRVVACHARLLFFRRPQLRSRRTHSRSVVSQKTLTKFAREARAAGKASFAFAWVMDEEEGERSRCVVVVAVRG